MKSVLLRIFVVLISVAILYFAFVFWTFTRPSMSPRSVQGRDELLKIAAESKPIVKALAQYNQRNGHYPSKLADIQPYLSQSEGMEVSGNHWRDWEYDGTASPDPLQIHVCGLWRTVWNRDDGLRCTCSPSGETWEYDPGDGSPKTPLPFSIDETAPGP
jgi:hypothetical protein